MAGIFGSAAGTSQAMADMQRAAQTQGQQLQNQQAALQLQEQQKMSQMMAQAATNPREAAKSPADKMEDMAQLALNAGLTASGSKLATDAAGVRLKEAQSRHANAQTFEQQSTAAKAELDTVTRLLQGVNDQASWDAANGLFEQIMGRKSPFQGMEYNPAVVSSLQQSALSLKDKLDLAIKQQRANSQQANDESNISFRKFREGVLAQDLRIKQSREDRLRKTGGKNADIGAPGKSELDHASDLVQEAYPDLPQDELNSAAYTVAARARALRKTTPGLDADAATERALLESRAQFQTVNDSYHILGVPVPGTSRKETHFSRTGKAPRGNPGTPQPVPADKGKLVKGQTYRSASGQVGTWNGESFDLQDTADMGDEE